MREARSPLVLAMIVGVMLLIPVAVHAVTIESGYDWFLTDNAEFKNPKIDGNPETPDVVDPVQLKSFLPSFINGLFPSPVPAPLPPTLDIQWLDRHGTVTRDTLHAVRRVEKLGPVPDNNLFDTIVRRLLEVTPSNNNATNTVPIEMIYLSLMSMQPVTVEGVPDMKFNLFVGLARDPQGNYIDQTDGKMRLTCDDPTDCVKGPADIGGSLDNPIDDPSDPNFLGLPVTFDVLFIPVGLDFKLENVVKEMTQTVTIILHGEFHSRSGRWDVPGPPTLLLFGLGLVGLGAAAWRRTRNR